VVGADRPHVHIVARAGWRRLQLHIHQLLVREKDWRRAAGNGEEAAPVPLILAALFLLGKPPQTPLPRIFL
jgi:hypothetical protein